MIRFKYDGRRDASIWHTEERLHLQYCRSYIRCREMQLCKRVVNWHEAHTEYDFMLAYLGFPCDSFLFRTSPSYEEEVLEYEGGNLKIYNASVRLKDLPNSVLQKVYSLPKETKTVQYH